MHDFELCKLEDLWHHNVELNCRTEILWTCYNHHIFPWYGKLKHHILPFSGSALHIPVHSRLIPAHFSIFWFHSSSFCFILAASRFFPVSFHLPPLFSIASSHFFRYVNYCNFVTRSFVQEQFSDGKCHSLLYDPKRVFFQSGKFLFLSWPLVIVSHKGWDNTQNTLCTNN